MPLPTVAELRAWFQEHTEAQILRRLEEAPASELRLIWHRFGIKDCHGAKGQQPCPWAVAREADRHAGEKALRQSLARARMAAWEVEWQIDQYHAEHGEPPTCPCMGRVEDQMLLPDSAQLALHLAFGPRDQRNGYTIPCRVDREELVQDVRHARNGAAVAGDYRPEKVQVMTLGNYTEEELRRGSFTARVRLRRIL